MDSPTLAFVLLIAALVLFIVSTRQWPIYTRAAVLGGGVLLLIAAWFSLGNTARDPELATALADFMRHIGNPGDSMLARMFDSNGKTIADIVLSLFDIFVFLAVIVAILAAIAFSPGEGMERIIRPVMAGMIGAILGGLFALVIVGTGFGTQEEERALYAGPVLSETVHSGDTLLLNSTLIRLRGVDAPEEDQVCRLRNQTQDCGEEAADGLRRILEGAYVTCTVEGATDQPQREASAPSLPPIVTCTAVRADQEFSVGARVVQEGYAVATPVATDQPPPYQNEARQAYERSRGLTTWCMIRPDRWVRLNTQQKNAFRERGTRQANWETFGRCPNVPPQYGPGAGPPQ